MIFDERDIARIIEAQMHAFKEVLERKKHEDLRKNNQVLYEKIEYLKKIKLNVSSHIDNQIEEILKEIKQ